MYPIVKKEKLADKIFLMDVKAPRVAKTCEPGQFVIVKMMKAVFLNTPLQWLYLTNCRFMLKPITTFKQ